MNFHVHVPVHNMIVVPDKALGWFPQGLISCRRWACWAVCVFWLLQHLSNVLHGFFLCVWWLFLVLCWYPIMSWEGLVWSQHVYCIICRYLHIVACKIDLQAWWTLDWQTASPTYHSTTVYSHQLSKLLAIWHTCTYVQFKHNVISTGITMAIHTNDTQAPSGCVYCFESKKLQGYHICDWLSDGAKRGGYRQLHQQKMYGSWVCVCIV